MLHKATDVPVPEDLFRERVRDLENAIKSHPQVEMDTTHYFLPGAYIRELIIPAGTMLVGRVHKTEHVSIMVEGEMTVVRETGMERICAPFFHIGQPGTKRVGYAHRTSRWLTVHVIGSTDMQEIEEKEFEAEDSMFDFTTGKVANNGIMQARADYFSLLDSVGISPEQAHQESRISIDRVTIDIAGMGLEIRPSPIDGVGVFTIKRRGIGIIGPARISGNRTQLGRFINHSHTPNAEMIKQADDLFINCIRPMEPGDEVTIDYRTSLRYRMEVAG